MKILHTADWHLGKRLSSFSRHVEQVEVLEEICEIAESQNVDLVLVAGDIFDAFNPPSESTQLFYRTVKRLSDYGNRPVVIIAGNHDSPERIISADPLAIECGILLLGHPFQYIETGTLGNHEIFRSDRGFVEIKLRDYSQPLRIIATPYASEFRLKKFLGLHDNEDELRRILSEHWNDLAVRYCDNQGFNILLSHLFFSEPGKLDYKEPDAEKPILHVGGAQMIFPENVPDQMDYVALGHLHKYHFVSHEPVPIVYSGSPISYSFSESEQEKYVLLIDCSEKEKPQVRAVNLSAGLTLVQKRFESVDSALDWLKNNPSCLVDLTIKTKHGISAAERFHLFKAHKKIISLIPERESEEEKRSDSELNPLDDMEFLFSEYYKSANGHSPSADILSLFREITSVS